MISGGRIFVGGGCSEVRNTILREDDFNFDGRLDLLKDTRCKTSEDPAPYLSLYMQTADGEEGSIGRLINNPPSPLTTFSLRDNWKWKIGVAKKAPLFGVGDKVATPLGEEGRVHGFLIYFDPEFNVVQ